MNLLLKLVWLAVRVLIALALAVYLLRFCVETPLLIPAAAVLYGFVLFVLFGLSAIQTIGERAGGLFLQSDKSFRIVPEYSRAEALAKKGKFAKALDAYRQVLQKFPDDAYAHIRIAELYQQHFHAPALAETELLAALGKPKDDESWTLTAHRLADLYQSELAKPQEAIALLRQIQEKLPGTKSAAFAAARIQVIEQSRTADQPPPPPEKISLRPSRYTIPKDDVQP